MRTAIAVALIVALVTTNVALAAPVGATEPHRTGHQAQPAEPSSGLAACLKRQSACTPMSRPGGGHVWIAAPASAPKAHRDDHQTQPAAAQFDLPACLAAAAPFYGPDEARAVCADMRAGV